MKIDKNICKFISFERQYGINTYNFVYEQVAANFSDFRISDYYTIYFVIDGEGELITKTQKFGLAKGDVFFSFKQIPFKINNTKNIKYMYISFDGYRVDELFSRFSISPVNCTYEGYSKLAAFWENSIVKANKKNMVIFLIVLLTINSRNSSFLKDLSRSIVYKRMLQLVF